MRVLVVGCGYLGARVARRLVAEGHDVAATTRSPERAAALASIPGVSAHLADLLDAGSLRGLPAADAMLVCVGFDRRQAASRREVHVEGLARLLEERSGGPVVYTSSTSVYGQDDGGWVDEGSATEPRTESGRVLLEAEGLIRGLGGRGVVLRLAGIYGPGRLIRREAVERGEPIAAEPDRTLNLIHVDDAARAAVAALTRDPSLGPLPPVVNVCDDAPGPRRVYYETAARLLGAPAPRFVAPAGPSRNDDADRRVSNRLLKATFLPDLFHPDSASGLAASLAEERGGAGQPSAGSM
jgi:nucleoside-diphosphate-sugar epimerase